MPAHRKFNFAELYTINMVSSGGVANTNYIHLILQTQCIEECNFIGCGYIEIDPPIRLDLANIRTNLQTIAPQPQNESIPFLVDAYRKCELFRSSHGRRFTLHLPDIEFIEEPCNPFALQITICVRIHAMQKCPSEFYVDSDECRLAREYFTQCVGDIETNLA